MNKDKLRQFLTDDINNIRENMFKTLFYIYLQSKANNIGICDMFNINYHQKHIDHINNKLNLDIDYSYFENCINYHYVYLLKEQELIKIKNSNIFLTKSGLEAIYNKTEHIHKLKGNYKYHYGDVTYNYLFSPKSETI